MNEIKTDTSSVSLFNGILFEAKNIVFDKITALWTKETIQTTKNLKHFKFDWVVSFGNVHRKLDLAYYFVKVEFLEKLDLEQSAKNLRPS